MGVLDRFETAVQRIGSHPWFLRGMLAFWVAAVAGLYWRPQPPGVAIALLGVGTIFMTFREMRATHKLLWAVFAIAMFLFEFRAIRVEHVRNQADADRRFQAIQTDNRTKTDAILKDNREKTKAILDANAKQFSDTEDSFSDIHGLATESLSSSVAALSEVTGAGSYAYAFPVFNQEKGNVGLALRARGPHALTGVTVTIARRTKPQWARPFQNLGTVPPGSMPEIFFQITPTAYSVGWDQYDIYINAQNGTTHELLDIRKQQGRWEARYRIFSFKPPRDELKPVKEVLLMYTDWWDGEDNTTPKNHFLGGPRR